MGAGAGGSAARRLRRPRGTATVDRATLRQYARERLPAHLVPAAFVPMAALPLTANRKVDRDALPPPGPADAIGAPAHVAPRTPLEATLGEIWAEVLGRPRGSASTTISSTSAATRCSRPDWPRGCATGSVSRCRCDRFSRRPPSPTWPSPCSTSGRGRAADSPEGDEASAAPPVSGEDDPDVPTLRTLLEARARRAPDAPAILAPGRAPLSYRELLARVDEAAGTARPGRSRPRRADRARRAAGAGDGGGAPGGGGGGGLHALNPLFPAPELESILAEARLDALIAPAGAPALAVARRVGLAAVELHAVPGGPAGSFTLAIPAEAVIRAVPAAVDDAAFILLTSGTTARPKRVP